MGNSLTLRPIPRRIHSTEEGRSSNFRFGASQITGWRFKQEDRYICIPKFLNDYSMFAVYDGHGGGQAVQYLYRFLHQHIREELKRTQDPPLALYLGFVTTDLSLRNITKKELEIIENDLDLEFEVPDQEERRRVLFHVGNTLKDSCGMIENNSAAAASAPCTSQGISQPDLALVSQDLRAEIASACINELNELKSVKFLTQDEMEVDESDEEYDPDKDNIKLNYFEDEDDEDDEESSEGEECVDKNFATEPSRKESVEENYLATEPSGSEQPGDVCGDKESSESKETVEDQSLVEKSSSHEEQSEKNIDSECDVKTYAEQPQDCKEETKKTEEVIFKTPASKCNKEESSKFVDFVEPESKFCSATGSTATVLLLNDRKIYIANVGDSRCVACVDGQAVDLTIDHKPTIKEERNRIYSAGGFVKDDRVSGILDMSRTFGDFEFKKKNLAEPFQMLSCEPSINSLELSDKLEFLVIASDGIWNSMGSEEVVDYIKIQLKNVNMELQDICGEMFEIILPTSSTPDGTGCDNLTAILIVFKKQVGNITTHFAMQETFTYNYSPWNTEESLKGPEENLKGTRQTTVLKRVSPSNHSEKLNDGEHTGDHYLPVTDESVPLEPIPSSENTDERPPFKRFKAYYSNEHYPNEIDPHEHYPNEIDPHEHYYSHDNSQACPINYSSNDKYEPVTVENSTYANEHCVTEHFLNCFQDTRSYLVTALERVRVVNNGLRATLNNLDYKVTGLLKYPEFAQQFGEHSYFSNLNRDQEHTNNIFQVNPYLNIYQTDEFFKSFPGYEENAPEVVQPTVEAHRQRNRSATIVKPSTTSVSAEIPIVDLTNEEDEEATESITNVEEDVATESITNVEEDVATGSVGGAAEVVHNDASDVLNSGRRGTTWGKGQLKEL